MNMKTINWWRRPGLQPARAFTLLAALLLHHFNLAALTPVNGQDGLTIAQPTLEITSPVEGDSFLAPATIEITAVGIKPTPGGITHVDFYANDKKIGESSLAFIQAPPAFEPIKHTFAWEKVLEGDYRLSARSEVISPEGKIVERVVSRDVLISVRDEKPTPTTVKITAPRSGASFKEGETITIEVFSFTTDVEFFADGNKIGESNIRFIQAPDPNQPINHSFDWLDAKPGVHILTARALGTRAMSAPVRISVEPRPAPRIVITTPRDGQIFKAGESMPVEATAVTPELGGITRVEFYANDKKIGESTIDFIQAPPPYEPIHHAMVWEKLETGTYLITARTPKGDVVSAPVKVAVVDDWSTAAAIKITSPQDYDAFKVGEPIRIEAVAVIASAGGITDVDFYADGEKIGESSIVFVRAPEPNEPVHHSFVWEKAPQGWHVLTVRARNLRVESAPAKILVGEDSTARASIKITTPENGDAFKLGQSINIEAVAVIASVGGITDVDFYADGEKIGESSIRFIRAPEPNEPVYHSFVWEKAPQGTHVLTVLARNLRVGSEPVKILVGEANAPQATLTFSSPVEGQTFRAASDIPLVLSAVDPNGSIRFVEFFANGKLIGESRIMTKDADVPGRPREHTFVWENVALGRYELTGVAKDAAGNQVVSKPVHIAVIDGAVDQAVATRYLPESVRPGVRFGVKIAVNPKPGTGGYAVEERPPFWLNPVARYAPGTPLWSIIEVSDGGSYDAFTGLITYQFKDDQSRVLTYLVEPNDGSFEVAEFSGTCAAGGAVTPIGGDQKVARAVDPSPDAVAVRYLPATVQPGTQFGVKIAITPRPGTAVYTLEERPPFWLNPLAKYAAGTPLWSIVEVSAGGRYDSMTGLITFGPFADDAPQVVSYVVAPNDAAFDVAVFAGSYTTGDMAYRIEGDQRIVGTKGDGTAKGPVVRVKLVNARVTPQGAVDVSLECDTAMPPSQFTLEVSSDLKNWQPVGEFSGVTGAGLATDSAAGGVTARFYRAVQKP